MAESFLHHFRMNADRERERRHRVAHPVLCQPRRARAPHRAVKETVDRCRMEGGGGAEATRAG